MPFLQIMTEPTTLSRLITTYEEKRAEHREKAEDPEQTQENQDRAQGSIYVLEATIEELQQALQEDEEDRQAFIEYLLDFWELLLVEWASDQPTERILPRNSERYQIARIRMLANVIHNVNNLESYE